MNRGDSFNLPLKKINAGLLCIEASKLASKQCVDGQTDSITLTKGCDSCLKVNDVKLWVKCLHEVCYL